MDKIDFTKYPKILPYVEKHIGKDYFKPFLYSELDEKTFVEIIEQFIDEYEKNREVLVKNTLLVYDLTNEETGHECLSKDWDKWREMLSKREKRLTKDVIEYYWKENIGLCINHIYQSSQYKGKAISGGMGGIVNVRYHIEFMDHEMKGYKYNVVTDFSFNINLTHSFHNEYDLSE